MRQRHAFAHRTAIVALFVLAVATVMVLVSYDAPTHDLTGHKDSAWYMMCGRAWACGMQPYVDFTDTKGPLLWLIYAAGYSLHPTGYGGIFALLVIFYCVACLALYRTARLFLGRRLSLCAALPMIACFYHIYHPETHVEDWAQPFFALSLYFSARLLFSPRPSPAMARRAAFLIGACMACLAMMKFTHAAMDGVFLFVSLAAMRRFGWREVARGVALALAGAAIIALPLCVLLAAQGSLGAMWREYVVLSASSSGSFVWIGSRQYLVFFTVVLSASVLALPRHRWFPLVAFAWFYFITIQGAMWMYYYNSLHIFLFFPLIALAKWLKGLVPYRYTPPVGAIVAVEILILAAYGWYVGTSHRQFFTSENPEREVFDRAASIMSQHKNPTLLYLNSHCIPSVGDPAQALPACRYWARLSVFTSDMRQDQLQCVDDRRAKCVIVSDTCGTLRERLRIAGYRDSGLASLDPPRRLYMLP